MIIWKMGQQQTQSLVNSKQQSQTTEKTWAQKTPVESSWPNKNTLVFMKNDKYSKLTGTLHKLKGQKRHYHKNST